MISRDWSPFLTCPSGERAPRTRSIATIEGVCDRIRAAAFAEIQAREAFLWAAERFTDAPPGLADSWRDLAAEEHKHLDLLLERLAAHGGRPDHRPVSTRLWERVLTCRSAEEFATFIAGAEERGRQAAERFRVEMAGIDKESAAVFGLISDEEVGHIELARRFYPEAEIRP